MGHNENKTHSTWKKSVASGLKWVTVASILMALIAFWISTNHIWNAPRPLVEYASNTLFSSFQGQSPRTMDPQASYSSDETIYTYTVYEPPYGYHYLKRPYVVIPRAAKRVATPTYLDAKGSVLSADAPADKVAVSRYRIEIRPGQRFAPNPIFAKDEAGNYLYHNLDAQTIAQLQSPLDLPERGTRTLTAADFVYGISRLASPIVNSPVLSLMSEHIVGLAEYSQRLSQVWREQQARDPNGWLDLRKYPLDSVRIIDTYTFEIDVVGKYPQFDNWLASAFFAPIAWEADRFMAQPGLKAQNISMDTWPVGAGPYQLTKSLQNREHVLERNPYYRGEPYPCEGESEDVAKGFLADCGKPTPFVDRIVMQLEKESLPTSIKFMQGYYDSPQITRLDVGQGYLVAAGDDPEKAKLYRDKNLQFPTTVEASLWYIGFNWLDPLVGAGRTPEEAERNRKLRQAISIAIDWQEQIAIFSKGQGQEAHGPLPPGLFGYDTNQASGFNSVVFKKMEDGRVVRRSIEEAKQLMVEAGYPQGRDVKTGQPLVLNFDWQGAAPASKSFLDWMTRQFAKIDIQLEIRATDYNRFQEKMNKGAAQIYYWGWLADYPDAENFLFLLYGPNQKVGGTGGENASNYQNPEYDRRFEAMRTMGETPEKARLINEMIAIAQKDAVWSFGYFPTAAAAHHAWVKNAKPTAMVRNHVQYLRVDPELRSAQILLWNRPIIWPMILVFLMILGVVVLVIRQVRRMQMATEQSECRINTKQEA